ncbi:MAG: hypothetical protein KBD78_03685 [Oligoflexales bacterium]|nr:hypothetical protein [Oligoflexales bacterium]
MRLFTAMILSALCSQIASAINLEEYKWRKHCQVYPQGGSTMLVKEFSKDGKTRIDQFLFNSNYCGSPSRVITMSGTYTDLVVNGIHELDVIYDKMFFTYFDKQTIEYLKKLIADGNDPNVYAQNNLDYVEKVIKDLNTQKFCGYEDWAVGESKEVTGKDCVQSWVDENGATKSYTHQTLKSSILQYDIYKISDAAVIAFGQQTKSLDGSTPDKRPKNLSSYDLYFAYAQN